MATVLDVSAALAIRQHPHQVEWAEGAVLAPAFFKVELANTIWKLVKAGYLEADRAPQELTAMSVLVSEFVPDESLLEDALRTSLQLKHPVYDGLYIALASRSSARLATLDRRLTTLATRVGIKVWAPPAPLR